MTESLPGRLLVVDDDPFVTDMIVSAMADSFHVNVARTGRDALYLAVQARPEVILLDIRLGNEDGYTICGQLKNDPQTRRIPVLFISSLADSLDKVHAFELGAADYIQKPIDIAELKMRIQTQVTNYRLRRTLEATVRERTAHLEAANVALRAMLENREAEIRAIEETILARLRKHVYPYLDKMEGGKLNADCAAHLGTLRANIEALIPSAGNSLAAHYVKLTPAEARVADLIRQGQRTKEIAEQLNLSPKSVFYYRNNIRKKFGLLNKSMHLQSYLESLSRR